MPITTPWGPVESSHCITPGITFYEAPGHGGIKLTPRMNAAMPAMFRQDSGWYEEDCEAAKVMIVYSRYFSDEQVKLARETVRRYWNDAYLSWQALHQSSREVSDQKFFLKQNRDAFISISAKSDRSPEVPKGMVRVVATLGGKLDLQSTRRYFLVPKGEYRERQPFGFVVDLERHEEVQP
jgi:hypothetical protein